MKSNTMKVDSKKMQLAMARTCLTATEIAVAAEMPVITVKRVTSGKAVKPATIGKVAKALGIDVTEILED